MTDALTFPHLGSAYEAFAAVADSAPDAPAISNNAFTLTYRELETAASRFAAALEARGVSRGDRVGLLATAGPEVAIVLLGCAKIGAIYLGLGPRLSRSELAYVLADARPKVTLGMRSFRGRDYAGDLTQTATLTGAQHVCTFDPHPDGAIAGEFAAFIATGDRAPAATSRAADGAPLALIYTSGSTGAPKGAVITHTGIQVAARALLEFMPPQPRALSVLPIDHIGFLLCELAAPLLGGGTLVTLPYFDPILVLETIEGQRVTTWGPIPTMLQRVLASGRIDDFDLSSLDLLWWSGPLPPSAIARLRTKARRLGISYGMTEATGTIAFTVGDHDDATLAATVGRPHRYIDVRLRDEPETPAAEPREILLRGPQLMAGYWNKPDLTAQAFIDGDWFCTGDLGIIDDGGLRVVGRKKELIRSGGYNIVPTEVERALEEHPAVQSAFVVPVSCEVYGEAVHAECQPAPGATIDRDELDAHVRTRLPGYKAPKSYGIRDSFPLLANGKVDRKSLARECQAQKERSRA